MDLFSLHNYERLGTDQTSNNESPQKSSKNVENKKLMSKT